MKLEDLLRPESKETKAELDGIAREMRLRQARNLGEAEADAWRECGQIMDTPTREDAAKSLTSDALTRANHTPTEDEITEYLAGWEAAAKGIG